MTFNEPDLILTKETYIQYIKNAPVGQEFYYQRSLGFNIKFIENDLRTNHGIEVKYHGEYDAERKIYKLRVLSQPMFHEEIVEQKTIFFDPQNLL